jgi:hypothetical protein
MLINHKPNNNFKNHIIFLETQLKLLALLRNYNQKTLHAIKIHHS